VCGVAATLSEKETEHERTMDSLNNFIEAAHLKGGLPDELRAYFRYAHTATRHADWVALLGRMSPGLRGATALAVHGGWLASVRLLSACPPSMHVELAFAFVPLIVPPGEALAHQNGRVDKLVVLQKGLVLVGGMQRVVSAGGVLGEELLWSNRRTQHGALSLTFVEAQALSRERLLSVLDAFPASRRRVRADTVVAVLCATLLQMRLAAAGVRATADAASAYRQLPAWSDLLDACQPPGCSRHVEESYCLLSTPLQLRTIEAAAPAVWLRFHNAALLLQRAARARTRWRAAAARRAAAVAAAAAARGEADPAEASATSQRWHAAFSGAKHAEDAAALPQPLPAGTDAVAAAVAAALAPQLAALAAAQAALADDVARLRSDCAASAAAAAAAPGSARAAAAAAAAQRWLSPAVSPAVAEAEHLAGLRRVTSWASGGASPPRSPGTRSPGGSVHGSGGSRAAAGSST
jgi:hypothetical protein